MKYCLKCGTLLEDSHEICIGCGSDVTEPDSWSLYPPDIAKQVEIEKNEKKSRGGLIAAMIAVFVLIVAAIAVFVVINASRIKDAESEKPVDSKSEETTSQAKDSLLEQNSEETVSAASEETKEAAEAESEGLKPLNIEESSGENKASDTISGEATQSGEREVKDSEGRYYNVGQLSDAAGNVMFTTLYPEDFSEKVANISYDVYSNRFPETITYIVGNEDGNVQFTFMSPQHYWYRKSDYKSKTRSNERDIDDYMQFLTYSGAEGYIEALIKQSYTDIKGFKLISKEEFYPEITSSLTKTSNDHTTELLGDIGDYAKIASDTVYAAMQAECDASIYHYEATSRQGNTIYMDFFVPVIANTLGYVSESASDKGEITEWVVPELIAFEAGNEELYNYYQGAYKLFLFNSKLSDEFFYINDAYSAVIEDAVKVRKEPYKLNAEKLKAFHSKYNPGAEIKAFSKGIKEFLNTSPSECTSFEGEKNLLAENNTKVGYFSKEKNKVFISSAEDEYPGSDYIDLTFHEGSASDKSEEAVSSESSSKSE